MIKNKHRIVDGYFPRHNDLWMGVWTLISGLHIWLIIGIGLLPLSMNTIYIDKYLYVIMPSLIYINNKWRLSDGL